MDTEKDRGRSDSRQTDILDRMEMDGKAGDDEILVRARRIQSEVLKASEGDEDRSRDRKEIEETHKKADAIRNRRKKGNQSLKSQENKSYKHSKKTVKKKRKPLLFDRIQKATKPAESKADMEKEEKVGYFDMESSLFKRPENRGESADRLSESAGAPSSEADPGRKKKASVSKKGRRKDMALFKKKNSKSGDSSNPKSPTASAVDSLKDHDLELNSVSPSGARGVKVKSRGRKRRILAQAVVCLLLVCAFTLSAGAGAVAAYYKAATTTINTDTENALRNANVVDADLVYDQDVVNILLIGCDKRQDETEAGRSDTTMIATIDIKNGKLKLTSLMRDMYIDIPGYGFHKFNAAYSYGGVQLEYETIAQNFGIKLDGYVEVDMAAFREVVELLGGVPMELTEAEAYFLQTAYVNSKHGEKDVTAGPNMMTPYQALAYCRIRQDVSGEFGRTDRQRKVLISIYDEMKKEDIMTITNICMRALRYVTTDLTEDQIRSLLTSVISMGSTEIEQLRIPYEGSYTAGRLGAGGAWVMETDYDANSAALQYFIFGVGEDPQIEDEYGVGNDRFVDGYYPEKTEGISTY